MFRWFRRKPPKSGPPPREKLIARLQSPEVEVRLQGLEATVAGYFDIIPGLGDSLTATLLQLLESDRSGGVRIAAVQAVCEELLWRYDTPGGPVNVDMARGVRERWLSFLPGLEDGDTKSYWAGRLIAQYASPDDHQKLPSTVTQRRAYLEGIREGLVGPATWHDARESLVGLLERSGDAEFEAAAVELREILEEDGCLCC